MTNSQKFFKFQVRAVKTILIDNIEDLEAVQIMVDIDDINGGCCLKLI